MQMTTVTTGDNAVTAMHRLQRTLFFLAVIVLLLADCCTWGFVIPSESSWAATTTTRCKNKVLPTVITPHNRLHNICNDRNSEKKKQQEGTSTSLSMMTDNFDNVMGSVSSVVVAAAAAAAAATASSSTIHTTINESMSSATSLLSNPIFLGTIGTTVVSFLVWSLQATTATTEKEEEAEIKMPLSAASSSSSPSSSSKTTKAKNIAEPRKSFLMRRKDGKNVPIDDNNVETTGTTTDSQAKSGMDRRGTLLSLMSGAMSLAVGDMVMNTAIETISAGAGGTAMLGTTTVFERVMSFGRRYKGAIASEELMAWVATQQQVVAKYPELQAWLSAQKKLQAFKSAATAATATRAATATTTRRAAATSSFVMEEGVLVNAATAAAASAAAVKNLISSQSSSSVDIKNNSTIATTASLEATETIDEDIREKGSAVSYTLNFDVTEGEKDEGGTRLDESDNRRS